MSCGRAWEVEAVADGRLTGSELASFERHLTSCAACQTERRALVELHAKLRALPEPRRSELETERLRGALLRAANERLLAPRRRYLSWAALGAVATAAAAVVVVVATRAPHEAPLVAHAEPVTSIAHPEILPEVAGALPPLEPATSPAPPRTSSPPLFERGVTSFRRGNYGLADEDLGAFVRASPGDPRCEDAAYLRAVARWRMGDRETATRLARDYLETYPDGLRRAEAERIVTGTAR